MADTPMSKWFNLIVRFEGLLDVIHEAGSTWIVVPDVSDPEKLALHENVLREDGKLMIEPHVPKMHIAGQRPTAVAGLITFEADFVNTPLEENREPCPAPTPANGNRRSLLWVPNLITLSGKRLRDGLSDGAARYQQHRIVTASVRLDQGVLVTEDFWWARDNTYWKTDFNGKYPSERALARSIILVATVAGGTVTVRTRPFDQTDPEDMIVLTPLADHGAVEVTISNHPGHEKGGPRDFAAHYVLHQDSELMSSVPLPDPSATLGPRGLDPQCTPGDNDP